MITKKAVSNTLKIENEDCYHIGDALAIVIDGASGLDKVHITDAASDAAWYSYNIKNAILNFQNVQNIRDSLYKSLQAVNEEFKKFSDFKKVIDFPSAVISMARIRNHTLEILVLGDCTCIIKKANGEVERIIDDRIEKYDGRALRCGVEKRQETGVDFCDTRSYYQPVLTENRKRKNKKDGYFCLSDDENAVQQAIVKYFSLEEIRSVALMSDGFSQVIDLFHLYSEQELMSALAQKRAEDIYDELFHAQGQDDKMNEFPRFSFSDDATLVYFEL